MFGALTLKHLPDSGKGTNAAQEVGILLGGKGQQQTHPHSLESEKGLTGGTERRKDLLLSLTHVGVGKNQEKEFGKLPNKNLPIQIPEATHPCLP